jgi:hypothetical protein
MPGPGSRRARQPGRAAIAMLAVLLTAVLTTVLAQAAPAKAASGTRASSAATKQDGNLALLDVVVLVDESGSETPQKVADERATAGSP